MFHCSTHRCSCRKCIPSRFTQTPAWLNMQAPGEHGGTHAEGYRPFVAVDSNMLPQSGPPWVPGSWASQMLDCRSHLVWNLILLQTAPPGPLCTLRESSAGITCHSRSFSMGSDELGVNESSPVIFYYWCTDVCVSGGWWVKGCWMVGGVAVEWGARKYLFLISLCTIHTRVNRSISVNCLNVIFVICTATKKRLIYIPDHNAEKHLIW